MKKKKLGVFILTLLLTINGTAAGAAYGAQAGANEKTNQEIENPANGQNQEKTESEKEKEQKAQEEKMEAEKAEAERIRQENIKRMDEKVSKRASGSVEERLKFVMGQFPPSESYFTMDGEPCISHKNCRTFEGGKQCLGFARYVFYQLYDELIPPTSSNLYGKVLAIRSLRQGKVNADSAKVLFSKAKTGDVFQAATITKSGYVSKHTMIVLEATEKGVEVYDGNFDNKCGVQKHFLTYEYIAQWCTSIDLGSCKGSLSEAEILEIEKAIAQEQKDEEKVEEGENELDEESQDFEGIDSAKKFTDVSTHWAKAEIFFALENKLFSGMSESLFAPDEPMSRGMFVTVLGRFSGVDEKEYGETVFQDVNKKQYYAPYVAWAKKQGLVNGMSDTLFQPEGKVTREQMSAILYKYADQNGVSLNAVGKEPLVFLDEGKIGSWALESVRAVQKSGMITGRPVLKYEKGKNQTIGYKFDPSGTATRAEVAVVLKRFYDLFTN